MNCFDLFNVTNTASFDIPLDDVTQDENSNGFPVQGTQLYNPRFGLGVTNKTSGSPRQVQMSLAFIF